MRVTYDEGEMKLGLQFSFARGIPPILASDDGEEVVGNLIT